MKDTQFNRLFTFCCSLVPAVMLTWDFATGRTTDAQSLLRITGICTFIFLALSLTVTPLRRLTGKNHWSLYRRQLGLYAFFYGCLHLLIVAFCRDRAWDAFWKDIAGGLSSDQLHRTLTSGRPPYKIPYDLLLQNYVLLGLTAFTLMIPLAATSTVWAIKKMGNKNWKRLHKLVYITVVAALTHYWFTKKAVPTPLKFTFIALFAALLLFRLWAWLRDKYFPAPKPTPAKRPAPAAPR